MKYRNCRNPTPCKQIQPGTQETLRPIPKAIIFYKYQDLYKTFLKLNSSVTNFQESKSIFEMPLIILKTLRNTYFPEDLLMALVKNKVKRARIVWKWLSSVCKHAERFNVQHFAKRKLKASCSLKIIKGNNTALLIKIWYYGNSVVKPATMTL